MRNADPRGPQGGGVWPLRHKDFDKAGFDLEFRSAMLAYAVKDRKSGDSDIGQWIFDDSTLGDVIGALCWPNTDDRPIPGWSWVWPTVHGKKAPPPKGSVATPGPGDAPDGPPGAAVVPANPADGPDGGLNGGDAPPPAGPAGNPGNVVQGINNGNIPGRPGSGYNPGNNVLIVGVGGKPIGYGNGFAGFSFGGSSSAASLSGIAGVGTGLGFAGFSFGGSSSAASLSGIPGVGTGSQFAQFINPADPYRNPFGNKNAGLNQNPGGMPGAGGAAGDPGAAGQAGVPGQAVGQPDPSTQPATGGAKQPGCGTMPAGQAKLRPIQDEKFNADTRYKEIDANLPGMGGKNDTWPKMPKGIFGLTVCATEEKKQIELFFPTSPFLGVAINAAGDPLMGSLVIDANKDFELDPSRKAPLQSAFWVIQKPLGGDNAIALNLGPSGCQDTEGGYCIDVGSGDAPPAQSGGPSSGDAYPSGPNTAPGAATGDGGGAADKGKDRIIGRLSKNVGGPLWVGTKGDKHKVGQTKDKIQINRAHIWTGALFKKNDAEDGPILFEDVYKQGQDQQKVVPCHLSWDSGAKMWKIWSTTLMYPPEPPPPWPPPPYPPDPPPPWGDPPPDPPTPPEPPEPPPPEDPPEPPATPGDTPDPGVPSIDSHYQHPDGSPIGPTEGPNTYDPMSSSSAGAPMSTANVVSPVAAAGLVAQAQNYSPNAQNTGTFNGVSQAGLAKQTSNAISGVASAFAAQGGNIAGTPPAPPSPTPSPSPTPPPPGAPPNSSPASGDPWDYTTSPKGTKMGDAKSSGKWNNGTANGGWCIHPPETDLRDVPSGMIPPGGSPISTVYFMTAPGAWFGCGVPQLENGAIKDGYSWGMDSSTGDMIFRSHTGGQIISEAVRFKKSSQRIQWNSGVGQPGELAHANTSPRTYFFPDAGGTVMVETGPIATGAGGNAVMGKVGGSGPASTAQAKWLKLIANDGQVYFVGGFQ